MEREFQYRSLIYNPVKAFLYFLPSLAAIVTLVILTSRYLQSDAVAVIGWILACSLPFIFQKSFKRLFTSRVELIFNDQYFQINKYKLNKDVLLNELIIYWENLQSYKCNFSSNSFELTIILKNGSNYNMSFKEDKTQEQMLFEKSVFSIFSYCVSQYNLNKNNNKILFEPGYLTTKSGTLLVYILITLAIAEIIIHFLLAPNSFLLSFMSLFIIIGILVKRKTDKNSYYKISHLESRNPESFSESESLVNIDR